MLILIITVTLIIPQFDDNVYQARRNAHKAIEMCVHMSPGTEGVVEAKLVPVLVGKLLDEQDEIKVGWRSHSNMSGFHMKLVDI